MSLRLNHQKGLVKLSSTDKRQRYRLTENVLYSIKHFDINIFALIITKKTCKNFMALIKIKLIFKNENINVTLKSSSIQSKTAINRNAPCLKY